jgi:iron-sulfur cluster repair protein YtfE (RIC family)
MELDPTLTVAQLALRHPAGLPILTAAGIDTCCDGGLTLAGAAARAGISLENLLRQLHHDIARDSAPQAPAPCTCDCGRR